MPGFFDNLSGEISSLFGVAVGRGRGLYDAYARYRSRGDAKSFVEDILRLYPDRKMVNLRIDSDTKTIHLEVQLQGQPEPLKVTGKGVRVTDGPDGAFLTLDEVDAAPLWLAAAVKPLGLARRRIPIPPDYVDLAKLAI